MSCNRNEVKVSTTAAAKAGINALASQAGNVAGAAARPMAKIIDAYDQSVIRRVAPASNAVLAGVDRPAVAVARALPYLAAASARFRFGAAASILLQSVDLPDQVRGQKLLPATSGSLAGTKGLELVPAAILGVAKRTRAETRQNVKDIGTATTILSTLDSARGFLMDLNLNKQVTQTRTLALQQDQASLLQVDFGQAPKLSAFLNKSDLVGSHRAGQNMVSSQGDIVSHKGRNWHKGTMVIKTPAGVRTLTHVQSLSAPSHHFYFDRALSDEETAEVVTASGRPVLSNVVSADGKLNTLKVAGKAYTSVRNKVQGLKTPSGQTYRRLRKPQHIEGYVGEVHTIENLMPLWGGLKKAMITTRLYHPSQETRWVTTRQA